MHGHHKQRFDSHRHPLMHSPDFFHDVTRELSARADGGHGLSSTNVIIIAVCCSVGGVVLGFVMWRLIRTCLSKSAPLPPVQPLARHRDQQRQESDKSNRVSTWNHDLAIQGRNPSHLYASEDGSDAPLVSSRHQSFQTDDTDTSPVDSALPLPNPAFRSSWGTRDSSPLSSVGALTASDEFSPPPLTPPSAANSTSSLSNSQSPQTNTSSGTFNGQPARQNKSRPISSVSSRTSLSTKNTIRGSPHGPHSNIQIILPTPLASELQPYPAGGSRVSSREDLSSRNSFVDRWLPVGGPDDNEDPNLLRQNLSQNTIIRQSSKGSIRSSSRSRSPFRRGSSNPPSSFPGSSAALLGSNSSLNLTSPPSQSQQLPQPHVSNTPNIASSSSPEKPNKLSKQRS